MAILYEKLPLRIPKYRAKDSTTRNLIATVHLYPVIDKTTLVTPITHEPILELAENNIENPYNSEISTEKLIPKPPLHRNNNTTPTKPEIIHQTDVGIENPPHDEH